MSTKAKKPIPLARAAATPSNALGTLFTKAGLTRGIETSVVLGPDANYLEVIQAIAADGLTVEKTPEVRAVLEAIRRGCEQTLAMQQPAQPVEQPQ